MSGIEILGLAASVLQIAELAVKLSVRTFTFTRKVKNANKSIDALSGELAATGAVLQQLGETLSSDVAVKVCSQEAIDTAKALVADTNKVFGGLTKLIDGGERSSSKVSLKQQFKFPFLEPQIAQLQANLERLKSSLLVILNVLIYAEQLRNQETRDILKDQHDLLTMLVKEKDENEKRYQSILKAIHKDSGAYPRTISDELSTATLASESDSTIIADDASLHRSPDDSSTEDETTMDTSWHSKSFEAGGSVPFRAVQNPSASPETISKESDIVIPLGLEHFRTRIRDHSDLVQDLLRRVRNVQYDLDYSSRDRLHNGILDIHWDEWRRHRGVFGQAGLLDMLNGCADVTRYWSDRYFLEQKRDLRSRSRSKYDAFAHAAERRTESESPVIPPMQETAKVSQFSEDQHEAVVSQNDTAGPSTSTEVSGDTKMKVKEKTMKAGYSADYIEDLVDERKRSRSRYSENALAINASQPTYIRVQIRHVYPETLDEYQLPWMYDDEDADYLIIKEYISHEFQKELFEHTKQIKAHRAKLSLSDAYTKETVTTLKPMEQGRNRLEEDEPYTLRPKPRKTSSLDDVDRLVLQLTTIEEPELRRKEEGESKISWLFT